MTTTTNIACNAEEWTDVSEGATSVMVQLGTLGKGYLAVTATGSPPSNVPDDVIRPFHRIINREPAAFSSLGDFDRVWLWLPVAMVIAVTR